MCEVCRKSPCDVRCPNAPEQIEFVGNCEECGEPITTAYEYYRAPYDEIFCCEACALRHYDIWKE